MAQLDTMMTLYGTVRIQGHTSDTRLTAIGNYYYSMELDSLIAYWVTDMEQYGPVIAQCVIVIAQKSQ